MQTLRILIYMLAQVLEQQMQQVTNAEKQIPFHVYKVQFATGA